MYALDTNTVSYFLKGIGRVGDRLLSTPPPEVALPSVVVFELEFGATRFSDNRVLVPVPKAQGARSPVRRELKDRLRTLVAATTILPFGRDEARAAARIRADLEALGQPIGPYDIILAATALVAGATLVTHNLREFDRVKGLALEDWY